MADLFVLISDNTEPFVIFMLLICDKSPARTTNLTKFAFALLTFTPRFLFVIIKVRLIPKVSVAEFAGYSYSCGYTRGSGHTVGTCLHASVYHVISISFVTRLTYVTFSHGHCKFSDDVIVFCNLIRQEINALV
jgi:hypothetical protein